MIFRAYYTLGFIVLEFQSSMVLSLFIMAMLLAVPIARWLVPKMVKNGSYSSFAYLRLIWACFDEQLLAPRQDVNSWVPTSLKESRVFP
jgi:hypothetical protein